MQRLEALEKGDYPSTDYNPHFGPVIALSLLLVMKDRRWEPQWPLNTLCCACFRGCFWSTPQHKEDSGHVWRGEIDIKERLRRQQLR